MWAIGHVGAARGRVRKRLLSKSAGAVPMRRMAQSCRKRMARCANSSLVSIFAQHPPRGSRQMRLFFSGSAMITCCAPGIEEPPRGKMGDTGPAVWSLICRVGEGANGFAGDDRGGHPALHVAGRVCRSCPARPWSSRVSKPDTARRSRGRPKTSRYHVPGGSALEHVRSDRLFHGDAG